MAFQGRQCKATSRSTGKPCGQPAVEGGDYCRLHGGDCPPGEEPEEEATEPQTAPSEPPTRRGNRNAVKHGAYSTRLTAEEEPIYLEKKEAFTAALGEVDVFDEQILHLLALISTKVDQAVVRGAEHAAYAGMVKQILDLMKELKATRASKDTSAATRCVTFADLFELLHTDLVSRDGALAAIMATTDAPDAPVATDAATATCTRCGQALPPVPLEDGAVRCANCGHAAVAALTPEADHEEA